MKRHHHRECNVYTKLDTHIGYHQCPLDNESQLLTTFITPFGRFKYLQAPYGISSILEHYNRRMDEAFTGLAGYRCNIIIYDSNATRHKAHVHQFLQRCVKRKITLNQDEWEYTQPQVTFVGFQISSGGYGIDTAITDAISQCPTPTSRTDLRAFFRLANQLASSTNTLASLLKPLRSLLSTKNEFLWSASHEQSFQIAKQTLTSTPILSFYDPIKQTHLCTDASRQGLGFVPQQMDPHTSWFTVPIRCQV